MDWKRRSRRSWIDDDWIATFCIDSDIGRVRFCAAKRTAPQQNAPPRSKTPRPSNKKPTVLKQRAFQSKNQREFDITIITKQAADQVSSDAWAVAPRGGADRLEL